VGRRTVQADGHQVIFGYQLLDGEVGIRESLEEQRQHLAQRLVAMLRVGSVVVDEVVRDGRVQLAEERLWVGLAVDDLAEPAANGGLVGLS
jgi:hypothetical protein